MKKGLLLCLIAAFLVCCMAACGKTTPTPVPTQPVTEVVTPTPTEEPTEPPTPTPTPEPPTVYLKDVFGAHNMKVGTCLTTQMITMPAKEQIILENYTSVTMENSMKPDYILSQDKSKEAGDIVVEFNRDMIAMLDWAKEHNMAVRGHTLIWYSQTPQWIFYDNFDSKTGKKVDRKVMLKRMESYIRQVFEKLTEAGYADMFYAYDVANEAWMEDGKMRSQMNLWYEIIGEDYLWYAYSYARKYAPANIKLFYNDYNEQLQKKPEAIEAFVKTLVDDKGNSLIDGIGLQAHLYTSDSLTQYFAAVDRYSALGLIIEITELDVGLGAWQSIKKATDDNLAAQGRFYYELVNGIFERVDNGTLNMDSFTLWGINDSSSWRQEYSPLLLDRYFKKKPAFYGVCQMKEYAGFAQ